MAKASKKQASKPANKPAKMSAILGRNRRLGQWQIPERSAVFALFGTCHLDMRKAYTEEDLKEVKMSATTIFGGVEIIVPDGVEVRPSGAAFLASSIFEVPRIREDASLPPLILDSFTLFGRLRLHTVIDEVEAAAKDAELARVAEEERLAEEKAEEEAEEAAAKKAEEEAKKEAEAAEKAAEEAKKEAEEAATKKAEEESEDAAADTDAADEAGDDASEKETVAA